MKLSKISTISKDPISLFGCILGVVLVGYLGCRATRWIVNKCHKTKNIDCVVQQNQQAVRQEKVDLVQSHQERLAAIKIQKQQAENLRSAAATKIQSLWRGYSARGRVGRLKRSILSYALLEKAKPYIDNPSNRKDLPKASSGKTPVYLPVELPLVLKESGSPENQKRLDQMIQGRDLCEKNGYKDLTIPQARVCKNFIIESRLPIPNYYNVREQLGFYAENWERFTPAVREFTGFLCQSEFSDITGGRYDPYGPLSNSKAPVGRYDNIALYLEEGRGKIGLIDLEQFRPGAIKIQLNWCYFKCKDAVHLFPYHLDEIMDEAKKFDPNIQRYRKQLEAERDEALKRFKVAYENHFNFIKKNNITVENPTKMVEVNSHRREKIREEVVVMIREAHQGQDFKNCLGENAEEAEARFRESFPKILDFTINFLLESVKSQIERMKEPILSNVKLLSVRTIRFRLCHRFFKNFNLEKNVTSELQMLHAHEEWEKEEFAALIIERIFKELAVGGEIAFYDPYFEGQICISC